MRIELDANGDRVGRYNEDGSWKTRPVYTVSGARVDWNNFTIKRIDATYFVVLGPNEDKPDLEIVVSEG